jgi:hypothetical protein
MGPLIITVEEIMPIIPIIPMVIMFLKNNWKPILLSILVVVLLSLLYNLVYEHGKNAADKVWVEKYNETILAYNQKVAELEEKSHVQAIEIKQNVVTASTHLDDYTVKVVEKVKFVYRDKQGKKLDCPNTQADDIYLGEEFSIMWNAMNRLAEDKQ